MVGQVVELVRRQAGLSRSALEAQLPVYSRRCREAIDVALAAGRIHEGVASHRARSGAQRSGRGYFPGPGDAAAQPVLAASDVINARRRLNLRQQDLADRLGVSRGLVAQWELDRKRRPPWLAEQLDALASEPVADVAEPTEVGSPSDQRPSVPGLLLAADELEQLLLDAGWTQGRLAVELGTSTTVVCGWCRGRRPVPPGHVGPVRSTLVAAAVEARRRIIDEVTAAPGITREGLTRGGREDGRGGLGRGGAVARHLDELLAAGRLHEASHTTTNATGVRRAIVGLFVGPAPGDDVASMTGQELEERRKAAGWSRPDLGRQIGLSKTAIDHWEKGRQPIPPARVVELRGLFASAPLPRTPYAAPRQTSDDELVAAAIALVAESPGLPERRTVHRMPGDVRRRKAAIRRAEAAGLIERRPVDVPYGDGRTFKHDGLFPTEAARSTRA